MILGPGVGEVHTIHCINVTNRWVSRQTESWSTTEHGAYVAEQHRDAVRPSQHSECAAGREIYQA
jgi:hypothetical protein